MEGGFSFCKIWIMLQILTYLIVMVIAAKAKIKGTFQCTPPRHTPIKCSTTSLPTVSEGSFDCVPNSNVSVGETCNVTCNDGLYPAYCRQAVCEAGISNQGGLWSNGTFVCQRFKYHEWNEWNGTEYKLTNTKQSWEESRKLCESNNSHLVTIENKEENEFVRKMVRHCIYANNWQNLMVAIGLNDQTTEGTWEWSDGTVSKYINWDEGQPDTETKDCVYMHGGNGKWHDWGCSNKKYGVCERNNSLK